MKNLKTALILFVQFPFLGLGILFNSSVGCLGAYAQGNIGIGTNLPTGKLQINHKNTGTSPNLVLLDSSSGSGSAIKFSKLGQNANFSIWTGITSNTAANNSFNIQHGFDAPVITVKGDGKVGINEESPAHALDVGGNVNSFSLSTSALKIPQNAAIGKILTSDALGNATWQSAASSVGFGPWGDCAASANLIDYNPVYAPNSDQSSGLGYSVAISGTWAIVGDRSETVGANFEQGSVSFYHFNGTTWDFTQKIVDTAEGAANDSFGYAVSISGNNAIVGAVGDDINANINQGSISFYKLVGNNWTLVQKIKDTINGATGDNIGKAVSISGNLAIVGSPGDDATHPDQGSAYIYDFNGTSWVLKQKITEPTGSANDQFGYSVSINGNFACIGAPTDNLVSTNNEGSVSFIQYNGSIWVASQKIQENTIGQFLGTSVAVFGNYCFIGATGFSTGQGRVSVYFFNGSNWVFSQYLNGKNLANDNGFGNTVSLSSTYALVGTLYQQETAYLFQLINGNWQRLQIISDPASELGDKFGSSVSIDGPSKRFVIGAFGAGIGGKVIFGKVAP